MKLEQAFYQHIRQHGYWDQVELMQPRSLTDSFALAWSNPNTSSDPEVMYKLIWLLCSTQRRKRLNPIDVRILDRSAAELAKDQPILASTKSYVKYLWEQVYTQEYPHQVASSEF